ncbi:hypothetical protein TPAR_00289 [Tolypocladium paradoxum]|uniref:Heme haloperoxidase family profile domain-containing protein n=1 Tax=Tolypocladium paradoxum TaxID=94208 RepID=A0A2S4LAM7_9HYPO|nr:hypothetical protein TPAR_00289 [Tolypocladium paradoxum]
MVKSNIHGQMTPGLHDLRGPCPGLNAMANHNYIPRNGVATISQFIQGTSHVFGMGLDLSAFLTVYGAVFDGDLMKWSIGGPPPGGLLGASGLLGRPQGISNSHNKYECDVSPTRGDLYEYVDDCIRSGDAYRLQIQQFQELYDQPLGPNGYDLSTLTDFRVKRFRRSRENNPYFFNGPFTGVAVQPAAFTFIYRFMANNSAEYPEGYLDGDVLKSVFSITGEPGSFVYSEGHERIPENWYKRAIGNEYTIPFFSLDLCEAAVKHPEFLAVGGNTGKVNTFTGVNVIELTNGVFDVKTLLEGNNAICFAFQFGQQAAPDLLNGLFSSTAKPLAQFNGALVKVLSSLRGPQLGAIDASQLRKFPGSKGAF